jgi:hypothetical protein
MLRYVENAGEGDLARGRRVSEAFERAVAREHEAIAAHELASDMHEASATRLDAEADREPDAGVAARRRAGAAVERARAKAARAEGGGRLEATA